VRLEHGCSSASSAKQSVEQALSQLSGAPAKIVFGFVPGPWEHREFHHALRAALPKETRVVTTSTGGEITNDGLMTERLVVASLCGDIDIGIGYATGLTRDAARAGGEAVEMAASQLGMRVADLDRRYGGIVIDDGFKMKKEEMLLGVLEKNQGLVLAGGGASGYEFMRGTGWLGADGEVISDGVLLVLFRTSAPWNALRAHWFEPTGKRVRLTKVDVLARRILELDGKSAGQRWAEVVGMPAEYLTLAHPKELMSSCLAMRVGREYFMRAITKSMQDDTLESANMVQDDQELEVMRAGDIVASTKRFFEEEVPRRVPNPTAALLFDCGGRKVFSMMSGKLDELSATFKLAPPCAGFTVQYETYCGFMVNSTLTSVVFGSDS